MTTNYNGCPISPYPWPPLDTVVGKLYPSEIPTDIRKLGLSYRAGHPPKQRVRAQSRVQAYSQTNYEE